MAKRSYTLESVAELKSPLPFGPNFLGLSRPAVIGGVGVNVILPNFTYVDGKSTPLPHPHLKINWFDYYSKSPFKDLSPWGSITSHNPKKGDILIFIAKRLTIFSKEKVSEAEAQRLLHAMDDWLKLLNVWVEVIAKVDLNYRGQITQHNTFDTHVWLDTRNKGGKDIHCRHGASIIAVFPSAVSITPLQWRKILAKTSNGERPPESYMFLRDARRMLNIKRYRRAVLDAATATEMALTKLRDDTLATVTPELAAYVQTKSQQISGLVEFHKRNRQPLPDRIQQDIAEPRNKAIHEGKEPSLDVAKECLLKAEQVVEQVFPRRQLL